jgi:DNA-binding Lrp family transcriptional regulator
MKKMTIRQYADSVGISVQAAHKRVKNMEKYKEIKEVEKITNKFFLLKVNTKKGFTKCG